MGRLCWFGKDYNHPVSGFRITCLWCRIRRRAYTRYRDPPQMLIYWYKSQWKPPEIYGVRINPAGHFLHLRLAAIQVLDVFMQWTGRTKPFIQICEFLANYPTW